MRAPRGGPLLFSIVTGRQIGFARAPLHVIGSDDRPIGAAKQAQAAPLKERFHLVGADSEPLAELSRSLLKLRYAVLDPQGAEVGHVEQAHPAGSAGCGVSFERPVPDPLRILVLSSAVVIELAH